MKKTSVDCVLFLIGGTAYVLIEFVWRGFSHWSMFVAGGLCFQLISRMNGVLKNSVSIMNRCAIGAGIITSVEFVIGCIVNLWLKWNVWDYSGVPFNLMGQICLPFTAGWYFLSAPIIWAGDFITKKLQYLPVFRRRRLGTEE